MTHLTDIQRNSLRAMLAPMDRDELCEAFDLFFDIALKLEWPGLFDNEIPIPPPSHDLVRNSVNGETGI